MAIERPGGNSKTNVDRSRPRGLKTAQQKGQMLPLRESAPVAPHSSVAGSSPGFAKVHLGCQLTIPSNSRFQSLQRNCPPPRRIPLVVLKLAFFAYQPWHVCIHVHRLTTRQACLRWPFGYPWGPDRTLRTTRRIAFSLSTPINFCGVPATGSLFLLARLGSCL